MNTYETIVKNLEGRINGVNAAVATSGTGTEGFDVLREMISNGLVKEQTIRVPNGPSLPLYRLRSLPPAALRLVVDE